MSLATIFVAMAAMAVNFGWQKYDDGYEYLVQLEPETLRLLHDENEVPIDSHVPKDVQPIRRVRIVVGRAELPREMLTENKVSRSDEAVERSANFRPGEVAPPANNRYPAQPAAPPSTLDNLVQPLRDADDLLERGFEAGVDGLENTGQAIRGAVGNLGSGVQQQLQRTKETLVGSAPSNNYPAASPPANTSNGTAITPGAGTAPAGRTETGVTDANTNPALGSFPPPPLAGTDLPESFPADQNSAGGTNNSGPQFPADRDVMAQDNRGISAPLTRTNSDSRMVPVEPVGASPSSAVEVPPWEPWLTDVSLQPSEPNTPGSPASQTEAAAKASPANGQSIGWTALAFIFLAGSIGCNFFLGVSYLDIRNKYRAALRRTSRSFGRPTVSA